MNILDIAIAKQLAGGGGSGTDNYNELSNLPKINGTTLSGDKSSSSLGLQSEIKEGAELASDLVDDSVSDNKFVTSAEKLEWSGKQNLIDSSHKLSSDLVNDADKTNKFVTASEKEAWNGKQNLIDSSHKLSSDLVDDTNKTNKFVTSTEKNTWNAKQNAIDSDHKLSSSLVSFSEAEAAALASGINSTKVGQISTNQTNILYTTNKVGKNELKLTGDVSNPNTIRVYWNYEEGTVRITGSSATTSTVFILLGSWTAKKTGEYVLASEGANSSDIYLYDDGSWNTNGSPIATWTAGTTRNLFVRIRSGVVVGDVTIKPMVCLKSLYDADSSVEAYAAPNYDLTRLEAEDRASLAEEIDAGAKNKWDFANCGSGNWHATTSKTDTSFTITSTDTRAYFSMWQSLPAGHYVFSAKISNLSGSDYKGIAIRAGSTGGTSLGSNITFSANGTISGEFTCTATTTVYFVCYASLDSFTSTTTYTASDIMVSTKAAFGVSNKFVPYRVPINGVFWKETNETRSTSLVTTGIKFEASKQTVYRITATALRNNSKPTSLVIKHKLGSSYSENTFIQITANENDWALTACGSMVLGVGGYFEVYVQYNSAASNKVYVIVEELTLN